MTKRMAFTEYFCRHDLARLRDGAKLTSELIEHSRKRINASLELLKQKPPTGRPAELPEQPP